MKTTTGRPETGAEPMRTKRTGIKLVEPQSSTKLAREWDQIGPYRDQLISSGRDLSYRHILLPSMTEMMAGVLGGTARVLDAGCGTGTFLVELASSYRSATFVGVDPSPKSIEVACEKKTLANCEFRCCTVEQLAAEPTSAATFDAVVANMLLQNVAEFREVLTACGELLRPGGIFVFAVSHPCFWPRYWGYDEEPWFEYDKELWVEAPFRTSLSTNPSATLRTTHVHRPMNAYVNGLTDAGLFVDLLSEPMPDDGVEGAYPVAWEFPRFLIGRARRGAAAPDAR